MTYRVYCWRSGEIEVAEQAPKGTLVLAKDQDRQRLVNALDATATKTRGDAEHSHLVPGLAEIARVREAHGQGGESQSGGES